MDANEPVNLAAPRMGSRWFHAALWAMLAAFVFVLLNRHEILAAWWGYQLASSNEPQREQAGLCLAFMTHPAGSRQLFRAALDDNPRRVEAAVAAMAHLSCQDSFASLCRVARTHEVARVRAQAIESIMLRIGEEMRAPETLARPSSLEEPIRVVREAQSDPGTFSGLLAFECQIESASRMAGHPLTSAPVSRTVGRFAARCMTQLKEVLAAQAMPVTSDCASSRLSDDSAH